MVHVDPKPVVSEEPDPPGTGEQLLLGEDVPTTPPAQSATRLSRAQQQAHEEEERRREREEQAWEPLTTVESLGVAACGCLLRTQTVRQVYRTVRGRQRQKVMWVSNGKVMVSGPGQDQAAYAEIQKIGIDDGSINRLYAEFLKIDNDGSGEISVDEFHAAMCVPYTDFSQKVFTLLDEDGSGEIDFREFVIAVWNYCTFSSKALATFAFSLFDDDNSGMLEQGEVRRLIASVYGDGFNTNERVKRSMALLDGDEDGVISRTEFLAFNQRQPLLLFPAYQMQETLRRTIVGVQWWQGLTEDRDRKFRQQNIFEILEDLNHASAAGVVAGPAGSADSTRTVRLNSVKIHDRPMDLPQPANSY